MNSKIKRIYVPMTESGFYILFCLQQSQHGYGISQQVKQMTGGELMEELIYYGISAISLSTTGSTQEGLRACTSFIKPHQYALLEERLRLFKENHSA